MAIEKKQSWFSRLLGRSLIAILFGNFFEKKNNTAGLVATLLVLTLMYIVAVKVNSIESIEKIVDGVVNVIFVVVGYYFGSKQGSVAIDDDE